MPRLSRHTVFFARGIRSSPTDAERLLWRHMRMGQISGFRFRRQHPVGNYVVDFVCMEKRLAVEIDGGHHAERVSYDNQRTQYLKAEGYRVLRFWDNEVLQNIEGVKEEIWRALTELKPPPP